jgi:F-type H+-transporting ATPase subunit delta
LRTATIAKNYAQALFTLGERSGEGRAEEYFRLIEALAAAVHASPRVETVLMSPKVTKARKVELLAAALPNAPREFVLFLQAVIRRGRQLMLPDIAQEYAGLLDVKFNRVRAGITLAREPDPAMRAAITAALAQALGKEIVAGFAVEPEILGGAIVRLGERMLDGSVRRRLKQLRRQLLAK